jgi:hypothetical protein
LEVAPSALVVALIISIDSGNNVMVRGSLINSLQPRKNSGADGAEIVHLRACPCRAIDRNKGCIDLKLFAPLSFLLALRETATFNHHPSNRTL